MKLNTMAIISIHSWFRSKAKGRNLTSLNVQNNADTDLFWEGYEACIKTNGGIVYLTKNIVSEGFL